MTFDRDLDSFIDTTLLRFSSENGNEFGNYVIYLRDYQSRITDRLVDECLSACQRRGLYAERVNDAVYVTVNLNTCTLNTRQVREYQTAVEYIRVMHGRDL